MSSNDSGDGENVQDFVPTILVVSGTLDTVARSALRYLGLVEVFAENDHAQDFGMSLARRSCPPVFVLPLGLVCKESMTSLAREFIRSTSVTLDRLLALLPVDEQHDLLDALAAEVVERLDILVERTDA